MTTQDRKLGEAARAWLERSAARDSLPNPPGSASWPILPVLAAWTLAWVVLGWPWLSGRVTVPWDAKAHFLPQIQFLAQSIWSGDWPFWNPYVFAGHPQIADPQSMIFSPPFLALALVDPHPSLWAVDTTVLVLILLGGAALLVMFRDRGWHWAGALIAAIGFGFGASMAWRVQHVGQVLSMVYLVIAWTCLGRALERGSWRYGAAAGVVAGFMVLGRDQVALLGVYLLAGVVVWHWLTTEGRAHAFRSSLGPLLAGAIGGLAIVAVPVLLTALVASQSNRPEIDYIGAGRGSLHPALLLTWLAPDLFGASGRMEDYWGPPSFTWHDTGLYIAQNMGQLYIGAAPALLILGALTTSMLWAREIRLVAVAALVTLVYALGWYTPVFRLMHAVLPGVDLYRRPADATFLIGLLTAILAGYATHRLFSQQWPRMRPWQWLAAVAALAAGIGYAIYLAGYFHRVERATPPLMVASLALAAGAAAILIATRLLPLRPRHAALAIVGVTVADLAWSNGPASSTALPPAHYEALEPDSRNETIGLLKRLVAEGQSATRRDRVELAGLGFHWPNAAMTHKLESTLGYNPVRLGLYSRATGAEDTVGLPDQRKFSALFSSYRSPLAEMLGLRYVASGVPIEQIDKTLKPGNLRVVARTKDAFVYESPGARPRVQFAAGARIADLDRILATGEWPPEDPMQSVVLDAGQIGEARIPAIRRAGRAAILSYRNTEIVIEAESPDGGWVVLNDVWHPWWNVEVDGKPAEMLRANVLFRAVAVPSGRRVVRFVFRPVRGAAADLVARMLPPGKQSSHSTTGPDR